MPSWDEKHEKMKERRVVSRESGHVDEVDSTSPGKDGGHSWLEGHVLESWTELTPLEIQLQEGLRPPATLLTLVLGLIARQIGCG